MTDRRPRKRFTCPQCGVATYRLWPGDENQCNYCGAIMVEKLSLPVKFLTWLIETYFPNQWVSAEDFSVVIGRNSEFASRNDKLRRENAELNKEMDELILACAPVAKKMLDDMSPDRLRTYTEKRPMNREIVFGAHMKFDESEVQMLGFNALLGKVALNIAHKIARNLVADRERTAR